MKKLAMDQFGVMSVLYQQYSLEYCLVFIMWTSGAAPHITVHLTHRCHRDRNGYLRSAGCWTREDLR